MTETMFTYINEEYETNKSVLKNRKKNLNEFIKLTKNKKYDEWVVLATGSSANAVECAKYYVEKILKINIEMKMPFVFSNYSTSINENALYIGVTQGGHSFSTIEALKKVNNTNANVVSLTANLNSEVCELCNAVIDIGCGKEKVGYVTKGFSATVLTFMLMGLELAYENNIITELKYNEELCKFEEAINNIENIIKKSLHWYEDKKNELIDSQKMVCIGYGPGYGVAREVDTKITETVRIPMSGHELEEYMHGPYLSLSNKDHIIFIETKNELEYRQSKLRLYLSEYTDYTYKITYKNYSDNNRDLPLGVDIDELISPLLFAIPIQILSYFLAEDKGNNLNKKIFEDFDDKLKSKI